MSKDVVIILSHADTNDKLEVLDNCISEIKKQGYDTIISSHIEVPKKYNNIVNYIAYDMDNPMIKYGDIPGAPHVFIWHSTHQYSQRYPLEYNHSYAVMKLIKTSLGVAYANGYEKVHFVNYDYVLNNPGILKNHSRSLDEFDMFSYYYDKFDTTRRHINTGLFSVRVKPFLEASNKINSVQDFLNQGEAVFEFFGYRYYVEGNGLTIKCEDQESIFEGNLLNSKSTLKNVIDDRISIYLANEENTNEYFISIRIDGDRTEEFLININESTYTFSPTVHNTVNIIDITDAIRSGKDVTVNIPRYGFIDVYNLSTHCAICNVIDRNIINSIESFQKTDSIIYQDIVKSNSPLSSVKTFREISDSVDCDKSTYHKYDKVYPDFLEKFRNESFNMFEIGIEAGKSFKIWQEYFPKAGIYGMDIGVSFKEERGEVFLGDQSNNEDLARMISNIGKCKFVIDDGSHMAEHQLKSFYYLFENMLEYGGVYIIEDIECSYWRPKSVLYGYETGHLNLIEYFTKLNHSVNSHYNLGKNDLHIKSITFAPNCIIITKKTEQDIAEDDRGYRFDNCILHNWRIC